jgi:hypothetical protein
VQQTSQQLRAGGFVALSIGLLNLLIFGALSLAEHNASFILTALAPAVISGATGGVFLARANQHERAAPPAPASAKARNRADPKALRAAGNSFMTTGAAILVVFTLLAVITHIASFFFTAVAPGVILISMGLLYTLTSDPGKRRW